MADTDNIKGTIYISDAAAKDEAKNPQTIQETKAQVEKIVSAGQKNIFYCKSVFPFDFFPDVITIDLNKIDVDRGIFFFTRQRISIPFETVIGVTGINDILFGSVVVETTGFEETHVQIKKLWHKDAIKARRIIAGVLACIKDGVDLGQLEAKYVAEKVEEIGRATTG